MFLHLEAGSPRPRMPDGRGLPPRRRSSWTCEVRFFHAGSPESAASRRRSQVTAPNRLKLDRDGTGDERIGEDARRTGRASRERWRPPVESVDAQCRRQIGRWRPLRRRPPVAGLWRHGVDQRPCPWPGGPGGQVGLEARIGGVERTLRIASQQGVAPRASPAERATSRLIRNAWRRLAAPRQPGGRPDPMARHPPRLDGRRRAAAKTAAPDRFKTAPRPNLLPPTASNASSACAAGRPARRLPCRPKPRASEDRTVVTYDPVER